MPTRRLPTSSPSRERALTAGKEMKDAVPAPPIIPFSPATIIKLDTLYPIYIAKIEAVETALQAQYALSVQVKTAKTKAEWLISDFYSALQRGIRRGVIDSSVRTFYGLAATDSKLPVTTTEADVNFWGAKAAAGEALRIAAGGAPITFPAIAEVNTAVNAFKNLNIQQGSAKITFDMAQEALAAENSGCDKLILKMWNEIETTFDEGNKPSTRRKAREWGVVYIPIPGEVPSADDYSIIGKATDSVTGAALDDVLINLKETDVTVTTDAQGNYYIEVQPSGTYSLTAQKAGYTEVPLAGIEVTAGAITTVNIQMVASGNINGTVTEGGIGVLATMSVVGMAGSVTTEPSGGFTLADVPAGEQTVRAELVSNPAIFQTKTITVVSGIAANLDFSF